MVGGAKPSEAGNSIYVQKSNGTTDPNTKQANGRYFYLLAMDGGCGGSDMQGVLAVKYSTSNTLGTSLLLERESTARRAADSPGAKRP